MAERTERTRVVVTGMAVMSPIGMTVEEYWTALVAGRSGVAYITLCNAESFPTKIAGEVTGFVPEDHLEAKQVRRQARFSQLAVAAARLAIANAELRLEREDRTRIGVVIGNGNGGFPVTEEQSLILAARGWNRVSPTFIPRILPNMAAANIAATFGLQGYNATAITACAAGTQAIGEATDLIRHGRTDVVVVGGTEAGISPIGLAGFCAMRALTTRNDEPQKASRPFDLNRDGFVPSEGAGILILERLDRARSRGAPLLAEILGYGASSDAYDLVQPDQDGTGAARAMQWTLQDAGLEPADVDYINAHGTSTPLNDASETMAIKKVFQDAAYAIPISSTKSMIGHALGAGGALEAVAAIQTIRTGIIHPTINYETVDPVCDLDYVPGTARRAEVHTVLSNSFGFGGQNACLLIGRVGE